MKEMLFNERNNEKQKIDKRTSIHAKSGQIWHCKLGINIGSEENGKGGFLRPVIVLGHIGNMLIIAPTTSQSHKSHLPFYKEIHSIDFGITNDGEKIRSFIMLSQIKTIDSKRLIKHKYTISYSELKDIKKLLCTFIL